VQDRSSIRRNIEQYRAVLQRELPSSVRLVLRQLLADEIAKLAQAEHREAIDHDQLVT